MCVYVGVRVTGHPSCLVYVIEAPICRSLPMRQDVRNHSPEGPEWGYCGSGPAQLALALLCDVTGDDTAAELLTHRFKFDIVSSLPKHGWLLTAELIEAWIIDRIGRCPEVVKDEEVIELGDMP